jgi:hypothetical protein
VTCPAPAAKQRIVLATPLFGHGSTISAGLGSPILGNRMTPLLFAGHGIVPIGYAAFTLGLPRER